MSSILPDGCFETQVICRLAGIKKSTLDYWVRTGLVEPTVRAEPGHRIPRLWTLEDAVTARAIKGLRDAGCSVARLRKAKNVLRDDWRPMLGSSHLYWDGSDLFRIGEWSDVESLLVNPGQQAFRMVTLPVDAWAEELMAEVRHLPSATHTVQISEARNAS